MNERVLSLIIGIAVGTVIPLIACVIQMKVSSRLYTKRLKKEFADEIKLLMNNFITFYNQFEKFFDKDIPITSFIPMMQQRGITTDEFIYVPFGRTFKMPVNSLEALFISMFFSGKLILGMGERYNKRFGSGFEQLENYKDFSEKFLQIKRYHTNMKLGRNCKAIEQEKYYLSL